MSANILVVDDSQSMRSLVCSLVESLGYTAIPADSGEKACEIFPVQDIHIAVLDVNMGGIDGFETCRRLRALAGANWFPVIYLSATDSVDYIVEGLDAGGDAYVTKPVNPRVLEAILKAMGRIADTQLALDRANKQLEHLSLHDALTHIPNRRYFDESIERFLLQAQREKHTLALLLIDVDHFKLFNDHYGHAQGDDCLITLADALTKSLMRPIDMVARYGGEEFAVLLPNTTLDGALHVAARILADIQKLALPHEKSLVSDIVSMSIGIEISEQGQIDVIKLIDHADEALYLAKENGRNCYRVYEE